MELPPQLIQHLRIDLAGLPLSSQNSTDEFRLQVGSEGQGEPVLLIPHTSTYAVMVAIDTLRTLSPEVVIQTSDGKWHLVFSAYVEPVLREKELENYEMIEFAVPEQQSQSEYFELNLHSFWEQSRGTTKERIETVLKAVHDQHLLTDNVILSGDLPAVVFGVVQISLYSQVSGIFYREDAGSALLPVYQELVSK